MIKREESRTVTFALGDMIFEYDERKNEYNIEHHGISFRQAARVFFDYDRIEFYDKEHSIDEDRYDITGDTSAGNFISARLATNFERGLYYGKY